LPSREHSPRPQAYTGEEQHTGRRPFQVVSTEWTLHMDIVQAVRDLWGFPTIDLFATKMNNRLPQYMPPLPDPKALAVNALAVSWDGMNAYAFPPTPLIQAVLNKVMTDKVHLCLIAPCWPSQAWFPTLLRVVDRPPQEAPRVGSPPLSPLRASLPQLPFFLQATRLETIGASSEQRNFLRTLSVASPLLRGGEPLLTHISQSGLPTRLGVGKREYIRSFPLFPS
jgi:hypothetical protein